MMLWISSIVFLRRLLPVLLLIGLALPGVVAAAPSSGDAVPDHPDPLLEGLDEAEIMRLGEQMYRFGILPSGETMYGLVHGDIEVDASAFSCASCHLRAGLGSYEGEWRRHQPPV